MPIILVIRLGLIRFGTSVLVILLAGVLNRIMIADLKITASVVTLIFSVQHFVSPVGILSGHFSDTRPIMGYHRTPYILGGMAASVAVMPIFPYMARRMAESAVDLPTLVISAVLFGVFGLGTTISATAVNSIMVDEVPREHRGQAMSVVWIMTLAGFLVGSALFLRLIPAYDPDVLNTVFFWVPLLVMVIAVIGVVGAENRKEKTLEVARRTSLLTAYRALRQNRMASIFFVFLAGSNFCFFLQEYLLEAFGGEVLKLQVFETTGFNFYWSFGVIAGMSGLAALMYIMEWLDGKKVLAVSCLVGALSFLILGFSAALEIDQVVTNAVLIMGLAKGIYNIGLSHLTMSLVDENNSGFFMGIWNFMSGLAIASGEMIGGPLKDLIQYWTNSASIGYAGAFGLEAVGLMACLYVLDKIDKNHYWAGYDQDGKKMALA